MALLLALSLVSAACVALYVAAPRQRLLQEPPSPRRSLLAAGGLGGAGLAVCCLVAYPATALVITACWAMLCLVVLPHALALRVSA